MENLIIERKNKKLKIKKYVRVLFILNLFVFGIGVLSFFNYNYRALLLSQFLIMSMLLIISVFEYNFRKIENKLYNQLKKSTKDTLSDDCLKRINKLERDKVLIDKIGVVLISVCSVLFIFALILQFIKDISIFSIVKDISLISFTIMFLQESRYSKKLTSTIDFLIDKQSSLKNII